jgi:hypothetical protein
MPAGELDTVPDPAPAFDTVSVYVFSVNVAVTDVSALSVTTHVLVPEQPPPLQPVNVEPAAGVAVSVTTVLSAKGAEHVAPQVMPAGELETEPDPLPALDTVRVWAAWNVAVTDRAWSTVTMHAPDPEQAPLQLVNTDPESGVGVRVTMVPWS